MMEKAKCAYAINPIPELWSKATTLGWNVYWPEID
jgi:hypothetical protein